MANLAYGSIPDPYAELNSLRETCLALKQAVEVLIRQRKPALAGAITWQDLVDLEMITPDQVPGSTPQRSLS